MHRSFWTCPLRSLLAGQLRVQWRGHRSPRPACSRRPLLAVEPPALLVPSASAAPTALLLRVHRGLELQQGARDLQRHGGRGRPAAAGYDVQMCFNGNPRPTLTIPLTGTVAAGDVFVSHRPRSAAILGQADQTKARVVQRQRRRAPPKGGRHRLDRPAGLRPGGRVGHWFDQHRRQHAAGASRPSTPATQTTPTRSTPRPSGSDSRPTPSTGSAAPVRPAVRRHHRHRHLSGSAATAPRRRSTTSRARLRRARSRGACE